MTDATVETVIVAIVGLVIGSFLNVVIQRLPRRQSIVTPGSRCPHCAVPIRWYDNIPVVSFFLLRGRCRDCGARISIRYPIVEIATALVFVAHYFVFGWTPLLAVRLALAAALIALFGIDLEHHLLPDRITLPGMAAGLAASLFLPPGFVSALLGLVAGGGFLWVVGEVYYRVTGDEGMGGGDVKMLAMIGAFLGWKLTILTVVLSSLIGSILGLGILMLRRGNMKSPLPYGTFLALSGLVASLRGEQIIRWYLGF